MEYGAMEIDSGSLIQSAVELEAVRVCYAPSQSLVLDIPYLKIDPGERIALIGSSGSGKTTLLRLINGYVQADAGLVSLLGMPITPATMRRRSLRRCVGFIFQDFHLVERATVFENVLWGRLGRVNWLRSLCGWFSEADKLAAMRAIAEVDLITQVCKRVDQLSGGQQQRVAIARVLAQQAEIILADEPVSNLDPALTHDILSLLSEITQRHGATLVMTLHQPDLARQYADRIIALHHGQVVYDGKASDLTDAQITQIYSRSDHSRSYRSEPEDLQAFKVSSHLSEVR
jgi:phosphonate transport system ATP-binding protein